MESLFRSEQAELLFKDLQESGYGLLIGKKEYAEISNYSVSAVDNFISKGYGIPNYKKIGEAKNARVLFQLREVAKYLTDSIEVL